MNGQNSARIMEISSNLNLSSVNGTASPRRSNGTAKSETDGDYDRVTLTDLSAVRGALESTPASRPEMVAKAQDLIASPNYPSASVTNQVSQFLADKMLSQNN